MELAPSDSSRYPPGLHVPSLAVVSRRRRAAVGLTGQFCHWKRECSFNLGVMVLDKYN